MVPRRPQGDGHGHPPAGRADRLTKPPLPSAYGVWRQRQAPPTVRDVMRHRGRLVRIAWRDAARLAGSRRDGRAAGGGGARAAAGQIRLPRADVRLVGCSARQPSPGDMRLLFREELAEPRWTPTVGNSGSPADAPTRVAEIIMPQDIAANAVLTCDAPARPSVLRRISPMTGAIAAVQGEVKLDAEIPAANGGDGAMLARDGRNARSTAYGSCRGSWSRA